MGQSFYPITPVDVTPGTAGSFQDVDASSYIASGATGVILQFSSGISDREIGLRKNGSTDDRTSKIDGGSHVWAMVGVDASRIFECEVESISAIEVWLIGYTMSGVAFLTNAADKSLTVTGSWVDIDCSSEAPSATGIIVEINGTDDVNFALRKNGSSDVHYEGADFHAWSIIGCDGSQIIEGAVSTVAADFFVVGYVTANATFSTNADDISLGTIDTYTDIDCSSEAPSAGMLFVEVLTTAVNDYGLRENGKSGGYYDIYTDVDDHCWAILKCDSGQVIEGKIGATTVDFYLTGHAEGPALTLLPSSITSAEAFGTSKLNQKVTASAIVSAEAFGTSKLNQNLTATPVSSGEVFGSPTVFIAQTLDPDAIASAEVFGNLTVTQGLLLLPDAIASGEAFGSAVIAGPILVTAISSAEVFGVPVVSPGGVSVSPSAISSQELFGLPKLNLLVTPSGVVTSEAFGTAQLNLKLILSAIASSEAFGAVIVGMLMVLRPSGIASLEFLGNPNLIIIQAGGNGLSLPTAPGRVTIPSKEVRL